MVDRSKAREEQELERKISTAAGRRILEVYTYNTSVGFVMYALCHDGSLWSRSPFDQDGKTGWDPVPPIPGSWEEIRG